MIKNWKNKYFDPLIKNFSGLVPSKKIWIMMKFYCIYHDMFMQGFYSGMVSPATFDKL